MSKEQKRDPCFVIELNNQSFDEKKKISPIGDVTGIDGRTYSIDGDSVVTKTKSRNLDIVLNVNHGYDQERDKAAGWFDQNSLEVKEDGIYAKLDPTNIGEELISNKHFRYLSPEYRVAWDENNRVVLELVGVGLVNRPNVLDEALNNEETETEDVKQEDNLEATQKEKDLQTALDAEKQKNRQLEDNAKKTKIEMAIAKGELMPNKQEFAMGLDGMMLDSFLELNKEDAKHLSTQTTPDQQDDEPKLTDAQREVNAQLGIKEEEK